MVFPSPSLCLLILTFSQPLFCYVPRALEEAASTSWIRLSPQPVECPFRILHWHFKYMSGNSPLKAESNEIRTECFIWSWSLPLKSRLHFPFYSCEDRCPFHTRTCANRKPACGKHWRFPKERRAQGLHSQENPWFSFLPSSPPLSLETACCFG